MDWSAMLDAPIVVFGCGNVLFGDDGLAPRALSLLAQEQSKSKLSHVAFMDAGTSIRPLLLDMILTGTRPRKLIVVDVVQEPEREPGSIQVRHWEPEPAQCGLSELPELSKLAKHGEQNLPPTWGGAFLHQAPTQELLQVLHRHMQISPAGELITVTVQAVYIPDHMDDKLSSAATASLPLLCQTLRHLCTLTPQEQV